MPVNLQYDSNSKIILTKQEGLLENTFTLSIDRSDVLVDYKLYLEGETIGGAKNYTELVISVCED